MGISNRALFLLATLVAFGLRISIAKAEMIPGYIGQMTFRLTDDYDFNNYSRRAEDAKVEFARIDQNRAQIQDQVNTLSRQVNDNLNGLNQLNSEINQLKDQAKGYQDRIATLNQSPDQNKDQITQLQGQLNEVQNKITQKTNQYGQLKLESAPLNVRLDQVKNDLNNITQRLNQARVIMENANRDRENYERQLISEIIRSNQNGANQGDDDGKSDGSMLANRLGLDLGNRDGNSDGENQGIVDGKERDYKRGNFQGDLDGALRAKVDGERDGTTLGTRDGNISAANREGDAAGVARANLSDAAKVGQAQGKAAGLEHAKSQGRIDGEEKAEKEVVNKYESTPLTSVQLNGQFAGSFARRSPRYPGDFNGPSFRPDTYASKDIIKRAYTDGYVYQYRFKTADSYNYNIDRIYNNYYDSSYSAAYKTAYNQSYQESYNSGYADGDTRAYSRDYPIVKNNFYKINFSKFDQSPDRNSAEFKKQYSESELNAYNRRYEEIRSANFNQIELSTYNSNILEQTEIFHKSRTNEVNLTYNQNAILQFESSVIFDGGIDGVAKLDGVFQANEATLHNVTIKNFGFRPAENVRIKINNSEEIKLPTIPARSNVLIIGAGKSQVKNNAEIGSNQNFSLSVLSTLTSDDIIEALHFDNFDGGVLKKSDLKQVKINFPFQLSSLRIDSQLIKDVKNTMKLKVSNLSNRAYKGELKIEILANSQNPIISKTFNTLTVLNAGESTDLSDAEILINQDADIYRDISFSAKITQNGILLGSLNTNFTTMAKAKYIDKANAPVIIVDSNKNISELLDVISEMGGSEKISILDMSLPNLNAETLKNGFESKAVVVLDDTKNNITSNLNNLFSKSKYSGFMLVNETSSGLKAALGLPGFTDSQKLSLDLLGKRQVAFTNPYRADGVTGMSSFFATNKESILKEFNILRLLSSKPQEFITLVRNNINRNNFFKSNEMIKVLSLKTLAELLNINIAYDKSGNIFTRNSKWADMVGNDASLLINLFKKEANGEVNEDKLGVLLSAIAAKEFISAAISNFYDIKIKMMPKILNRINSNLSYMEDGYKKSFKNFDKELYNNVYDKVAIQRPFFIESTNTTGGN